MGQSRRTPTSVPERRSAPSPSTPVRIPPLYCPIPFAVNPHATDLNERGLAWISQFDLFPDTATWRHQIETDGGLLPAYVMPHAPCGPAMQAITNFFFWLWAFDDLACDEATDDQSAEDQVLLLCDMARALEIPGNHPLPIDRFGAALHDVRRQLDNVATPTQIARWCAAMYPYLLANTGATALNATRTVPSLETYVAHRIHSGAVKPVLMLLDVVDDYELPTAELERPDVWALNEMVCTLVGWDNDLLTYAKEVSRGGAAHNLITVLAEQRGCVPADAVSEAVAMRDRVLCLFLRLRQQVGEDCSPQLRWYLDGLSAWIRGHLDWGMRTARYRHSTPDAVHPGGFADTPTDTLSEPLPIPSIAWWWTQLKTHSG